jgi:hypothetical protein
MSKAFVLAFTLIVVMSSASMAQGAGGDDGAAGSGSGTGGGGGDSASGSAVPLEREPDQILATDDKKGMKEIAAASSNWLLPFNSSHQLLADRTFIYFARSKCITAVRRQII